MINKCIDKCDSNNMLNQHSGRFKYLQSKLCYFDIKIQIKNIIFYGFILNSFVCYLLFSIKPSVQSATVSNYCFQIYIYIIFSYEGGILTRIESKFFFRNYKYGKTCSKSMKRMTNRDRFGIRERIPGYDQNSFFGTKFWCKFN